LPSVDGLGPAIFQLGSGRLLAGPEVQAPEWLGAHRQRLGDLFDGPNFRGQRRQSLIELVQRSGLRGRGGAGFPTGTKLAAVDRKSAHGRRAVVVANGGETEPCSRKDRTLLMMRPHLVLDGIQVAAAAVGATEAFLVVPPTPRRLAQVVHDAIEERVASGCDRVEIVVVVASDAFVAGEETALVRHLEGEPALPRFRPPLPSEKGWRGRPTLVQNVETLANLALLARFGVDWFREAGTYAEPGTMLMTIGGGVSRPGVYEVAIGTSMRDLLAVAGSSVESPAILLGGYFGTWLQTDSALGCELSVESLRRVGTGPGAGVLQVLPVGVCGLIQTHRYASWLARQSAGQCGPCWRGLPAVADALATLANPGGGTEGTAKRIRLWCDDIEGRGACHHPDGFVNLIRSGMAVFAMELDLHASGRCSAKLVPASAGRPADGQS
jgi:NADH:ubiquinone oxidoreductase subunit F (NADH-binding)